MHPKDVRYLDLADIASVNTFVDDVLAMDLGIDILINNAGIMACPETRTDKGWELQFAANHVGHFVLTTGLIPALKQSSSARVVTLSSAAHKFSGVRWSDIHAEEAYDKWIAYGQSKTAACLFLRGGPRSSSWCLSHRRGHVPQTDACWYWWCGPR